MDAHLASAIARVRKSISDGNRRDRFHRISPILPLGEPAFEGPHASHASPPERERHPGAGRLVRSRAVHDHVPSARDGLMPSLQLFLGDPQRSRDHERRGSGLQRGAKVDDEYCGAGVEVSLQRVLADAGDAQAAKEALPLDPFDDDGAGDGGRDERGENGAGAPALLHDVTQRIAREIADAAPRARLQQGGEDAVQREARRSLPPSPPGAAPPC